MACMKCGKDTQDGQLFCARCLETMEAYPVKPDAHIQLPVRNAEVAPKKQVRKARSKDAQIATLRLQNRLMWVVILALLLALAVSVVTDFADRGKKDTGKNDTYSESTP